ncbi:hypothetical protein MYX77_12590, partial [Acidobacteriia bacterium AH_259_A11_L15]|nr:hypothetical protein [Acidobacteriia bacterium AH_259_A11_L15]
MVTNRPSVTLRIPILLFVIVGLLVPPAQAQRGGLTIPQNLAELVEEAATIVRGRVISARAEKHPQFKNLDTVVVTLEVSDVLKGSAGPTFTFRQFVWDIRDVHSKLGYGKGGEFLLLMIKPSQYGLSSPAGLEQGRFRIRRDPQGREFAVNGAGNAGLFRNFDTVVTEKGLTLT